MPRFRTGHRVPLNVYDGDRPIFQAHSEQDAVEWVALLNVGHRAGTITTDEVAQVLFSSEAMPVNNVVLARDAADAMAVEVMHLLLTSRETPVERPTEPPPATGQPADDSGPRDGALSILRRLYRPTEKAPDPNWEWEIEVPPGDHDPGPHWVRVDRHSRSWEYFEPLTPAERAAWEQLS